MAERVRAEYVFSKMKGRHNPYAKRLKKRLTRSVTPNFHVGKLKRIKDILPPPEKLVVPEK